MAPLNPSLPEQQEPNYLRYSRPQNFLEPNKAPGELFKAVGEVFTQGARGIDSTVKSGIDAYVGSKAESISNEYIHGQLEPEYQRVTGHNPRQDPSTGNLLSSYAENTPQEVKDLPQKMENLEAFKAKGGFVPTYYRAQLDSTAKSVRSVFPGFSGYIDRSIARATGGIEANAYAGQLMSGINAAEAKIDNEQKRREGMLDSLAKEGAIKQPIWDGVKKGTIPMDYAISTGIANRYLKQDIEISNARATLREKNNTLDRAQAEHDFDRTSIAGLSSSIRDMAAVNGAADDASHMEMYRKYTAGQIKAPSPEQMLELEKTHQVLRQRYVTEQAQSNSKLLGEMGSEAATKKLEHIGQLFDNYTGFIHNKDYENANSYKVFLQAHQEGAAMRFMLSPPGEWANNVKAIEAHSPGFVGPFIATEMMNDPKWTTAIRAALSNGAVQAMADPASGKPPTSVHATVNQLHEQGVPGDAKKVMLDLPLQITNPKVSDQTARNLVDFGFAGDGAKIWPQLERESTRRSFSGATYVKKGSVSVWEQYTDPKFAARVKSLGEGPWQNYTNSMGEGARHIVGTELKDLNNLQGRFKLGYDSDNNKITIERRPEGRLPTGQRTASERVTQFQSSEIDNINRVLKGWSNIGKQDPSINVNAEVLKILQSEGLKDGPVTQQIQKAIMASHKSAALGQSGEVMSDAGDQMGMGATSMNIFQPGSERSASDKPLEKPMTGFPARAQPPSSTLTPKGGVASKISTDPVKFDKLMEGIQAGKGQRTIAKELGIGRSSVQRYLQDQLQVKESPGVVESFWKPEKVNALKELYKQGYSQAEIAKKLGTSTGNIPFQLEKLQKSGDLSNRENRPEPSLPKLKFLEHPMEPE